MDSTPAHVSTKRLCLTLGIIRGQGVDAAIPPDPVLIRFAELMSSTISWSFEETPVGWIKAEAIWGDVMPSVLQGAGAGD